MEITNKRIVVTGAASGIGKELVVLLSGYDCTVMAVDRNLDGLSQFLGTLANARAVLHSYACDIGSQDNLDSLFDYAYQALVVLIFLLRMLVMLIMNNSQQRIGKEWIRFLK